MSEWATMTQVANWLYERGSSLRLLCNDMELPGGRPDPVTDRTLNSARQEIQAFFDEYGRRPRRRDLYALNSWLQRRGSSIAKLCNEMGLPRDQNRNRTLDSARQEIQAFYDRLGRRPVWKDLRGLDHWLRRHHGSSITKLCDEMGLSGGPRTLDSARRDIQAFYDQHERRPTRRDFAALNQWLRRHQDSSVSELCNELNL